VGGIIGLMCEKLTGHRFGAWVPIPPPPRFEQAQCRQWYVRPQRLGACPQCHTTDRVTSPDYGGVCVVCWRRNQEG
jgi:hypothetical protein